MIPVIDTEPGSSVETVLIKEKVYYWTNNKRAGRLGKIGYM
jgi:hypothetical protein